MQCLVINFQIAVSSMLEAQRLGTYKTKLEVYVQRSDLILYAFVLEPFLLEKCA